METLKHIRKNIIFKFDKQKLQINLKLNCCLQKQKTNICLFGPVTADEYHDS